MTLNDFINALKFCSILLDELYTTAKICDLGEARMMTSEEDLTARVGSFLFMAPEVK